MFSPQNYLFMPCFILGLSLFLVSPNALAQDQTPPAIDEPPKVLDQEGENPPAGDSADSNAEVDEPESEEGSSEALPAETAEPAEPAETANDSATAASPATAQAGATTGERATVEKASAAAELQSNGDGGAADESDDNDEISWGNVLYPFAGAAMGSMVGAGLNTGVISAFFGALFGYSYYVQFHNPSINTTAPLLNVALLSTIFMLPLLIPICGIGSLLVGTVGGVLNGPGYTRLSSSVAGLFLGQVVGVFLCAILGGLIGAVISQPFLLAWGAAYQRPVDAAGAYTAAVLFTFDGAAIGVLLSHVISPPLGVLTAGLISEGVPTGFEE